MSDITPYENLIIPIKLIPPAAFRAIFERITSKTQVLDNVYDGQFCIRFAQIEQLFELIEQSIVQYHVEARSVQFTLSVQGGQSFSFSSFEEFRRFNFETISLKTSNIGMEYDFLVLKYQMGDEGSTLSQKYRVRVSAGQGSPKKIFRRTSSIGDHIFIHEGGGPLQSHIEYSDYSVARNLQATVEEWVATTRYTDETALGVKTIKCIDTAEIVIPFLLMASALIGGIVFEPGAYSDYITPIRYLVGVIASVIMSIIFAVFLTTKLTELKNLLQPLSNIYFTSGDAKGRLDLELKRRTAKNKMTFLFVTVFVAVVVSIFSNYLTTKIMPEPHSVNAESTG